jgi:methanogenic corrinoid protein MtbC1
MWARHELATPEERFALNYARAFLFAQFHEAEESFEGPMVFVGCGPREMHDIGALTLAVFWRRAGVRVVYLGQDVEATSFVEVVRQRRPALVCLCVTTAQRIRSLSRLAKELSQLDAPKPTIAFTGPIFARHPELQRKVNGIYLGEDAGTATWHLTNLLGLDRNRKAATGS